MLYSMTDLLKVADEQNFAVGAFNVTEVGNFKAVVAAARAQKAPTIVQVNAMELAFCGWEYFEYVRTVLANDEIPYVLHLDHGKTMHDILTAIKSGFTSVMIDGSLLPFEENVAITKKVVEVAHELGVSVEGELGTIGEALQSDEGGTSQIRYTEPDEAKEFVDQTGVDTLAIAIGTSHGFYPKGFIPKLQIDRLKKIDAVVSQPLVLHGGSNNPDKEIAEACRNGVRKVNISTDYKSVYAFALRDEIQQTGEFKMTALLPKAIEAGQKVIESKMELFGSSGKASAYHAA